MKRSAMKLLIMVSWVYVVPMLLSLHSAQKDPLRRLWHDRLTGTAVVKA
jgi:uncharacterized RDD family membrane protein YckC